MPNEENYEAAIEKLDKLAANIRRGREGTMRPIAPDIKDPGERLRRVEDAVLVIQEALRALRD